MKQAILVTAYKQLDFLLQIVDSFSDDYSFYIHLDAKGVYCDADIEALEKSGRVKFISQKYTVNWGSVDHLRAINILCEEAIKDEAIEYIHLITGQDFPIKSSKYISEYLERNKGSEFICGHSLPSGRWEGGGLNRIQYYRPYEIFNGRKYGRFPIKAFMYLQRMAGFKRKLPACFPTLYGGGTYWTLSREAIEYALRFLEEHPELMKRFKYTFCSEEILIHSILFNSPFKEKIRQDDLRFIVWEHRDGEYPANLDERDAGNIINSEAIFARKFNPPKSDGLLKMIRENLFDK